jgi:ABC-type spermidine/putrescine transport system permease subunit I
MKALLASYGRGLVTTFIAAVAIWACLLIVLPQLTMLYRALKPPRRALDSSVVATVIRDAQTCVSVLKTYREAPETPDPSGGLASPSMGVMAVPGISDATLPYILQCDRASTESRFVRDPEAEPETLVSLHGLPVLKVDPAASIAEQIVQAEAVADIARPLLAQLTADEANAVPYTLDNFGFIFAARAIPMSLETKAREDAEIVNRVYDLVGLRFEKDGVTYVRLTLVTLVRTIFFAMMATLLALLVCYPVAFNLALASSQRKAMLLLLGLIIPYAIVELMRVYAWVSLIETRGLINTLLDLVAVINIDAGESIQFKRSPITVFIVIVYTYILFMVFPMVNVMSTLDRNQLEAARDLGASSMRIHRRIVIPHAKPGIAVGCITTFMLAAGAFSVPRIISTGLQAEWFSQTIYNKFFESENSNIGAAYSFAFTILCFVIVGLFMWVMRARLKDFVR